MHAAVTRQITVLNERLATVLTAVWPLSRVSDKMPLQMTAIVRGVLAALALVLAVPADVAVTLLHVFVQMILCQTYQAAVNTADHGAT